MHMQDPLTVELSSHSAEQTVRLGSWLGGVLAAGDVICLSGDLGAGKTAFASGIAAGWGALEPVNSPTFVLVHEHHRSDDATRLHHVDCYRLERPGDATTVGLEDLLAGNDVVVVEWPERIEMLLPPERLWIDLEFVGDATERRLIFQASGSRYQTLLADFQRRAAQVATEP